MPPCNPRMQGFDWWTAGGLILGYRLFVQYYGVPPDVVVRRVGCLLHEEQCDPLKQLVAGHGRHGQVKEQTVQHRHRDIVQRPTRSKPIRLFFVTTKQMK